jgi:hypothetical protein
VHILGWSVCTREAWICSRIQAWFAMIEIALVVGMRFGFKNVRVHGFSNVSQKETAGRHKITARDPSDDWEDRSHSPQTKRFKVRTGHGGCQLKKDEIVSVASR